MTMYNYYIRLTSGTVETVACEFDFIKLLPTLNRYQQKLILFVRSGSESADDIIAINIDHIESITGFKRL